MPPGSDYRPAPTHPSLGAAFFDPVAPAKFPRHRLVFRNQAWAQRVGLGELSEDEWRAHFAEFRPLPGNLPEPLALRYHGHQFDSYNPELGDGRGFLFAQLRDDQERLLDLGTKGSGTTPYSRAGDGRLTLKGGVREVLATEMLEAYGVYTSKSFSLFETGEQLQRGDEPSPTRSSVLVRLGHSHVRIGTFQRLAFERDLDAIAELVAYCRLHYFPELPEHGSVAENVEDFYREVVRRNAKLCADWVNAGFVHGVLNSDNMVVTGESFDYGPYRFLPRFDPAFTAAYFDHTGLYCYARQPLAVARNVARLADALLPLSREERLQSLLDEFLDLYDAYDQRAFLAQIGLRSLGHDEDRRLSSSCREFLARTDVGFRPFFYDWFGGRASESRAARCPRAPYYAAEQFAPVRDQLMAFEPERPERLRAAYFGASEPCDLLIDEIEEIWAAIAERDDFGPFHQKVAAIRIAADALSLPVSAR